MSDGIIDKICFDILYNKRINVWICLMVFDDYVVIVLIGESYIFLDFLVL